jgi:peptidoglycan/xylan/chitin deacetylase (PgdA/CDA1 family)
VGRTTTVSTRRCDAWCPHPDPSNHDTTFAHQIRQEIIGSQQDLHREIGQTLPIFCYPSGHHDDAVRRVLKDEGFVLAFTTLDGQNDLRTVDLLRLRRTNITRRTSRLILRLRLLRLGAYLDMWRHRKRRGCEDTEDSNA